jgi:hypothetical protein
MIWGFARELTLCGLAELIAESDMYAEFFGNIWKDNAKLDQASTTLCVFMEGAGRAFPLFLIKEKQAKFGHCLAWVSLRAFFSAAPLCRCDPGRAVGSGGGVRTCAEKGVCA